MKKLTTKTLGFCILTATVLLLISAPLYYTLSKNLYLEEIDKSIASRKAWFFEFTLPHIEPADVAHWNQYNRYTQLLPVNKSLPVGKMVQQSFLDTLTNKTEPFRVLYSPLKIGSQPYYLMIRMNLMEWDDLVMNTATLFLLILVALLAGFVIASKIIAGILWRPFYQTLGVIEKFSVDKMVVPRFPKTNIAEFRQLNYVLEKMAEENLKAYRTEKEFTRQASHELKTPVAVFLSKLDLLAQTPSLTEEQAVLVDQLYRTTSRLSRIQKNLLLLAEIESGVHVKKEETDLVKLISDLLPQLYEQAEDRNIAIQVDLPVESPVMVNKGITEILLNNLILNAISHNKTNGIIRISQTEEQLCVANTGSAKALDEQRLFVPFGKMTDESDSNGLGLALVKKITDLNKWKIGYSYCDNLHTFTVTF